MYAKHPSLAAEFEAATPKNAKLPDHVNMDSPTLADKMQATFSRNQRVIPKKAKIHPALQQAHDIFARLHGSKFAKNAGRLGKKAK